MRCCTPIILVARNGDFVKSHYIDGKVKSSYARRASHLKPSGAILRNEAYV
jgi:hypothetical protein